MKKNILPFIILAAVALSIAGFLYKRYRIPPSIELPAIVLTDLNGRSVSLSSFAGHPLFISFFATWCGPCIRELPELADLQGQLADQKLQVLCISDEPIERLQALAQRSPLPILFLHSAGDLHNVGVYTYPTNFIYDRQGRKVYEKVNPDRWDDPAVVSQIRALLGK